MTNFSRRAAWPCFSALAIVALTQSAVAQPTSAQQSALRSNCRSDFMSNCSGVQPGGKDALMCLQKNVAKLSPGCQSAVRATMPAEPAQAAAPPAAPPPAAAAAPPPPAAVSAPPATITSAPPPPAQTAKKPVKKPAAASLAPPPAPPPPAAAAPAGAPTSAQQNAMRQNCRNDFVSHCAGVQPGGKDALACLQRNVASLSPACGRVVSATMRGAAPAAATASAPAASASVEPEPSGRPGGMMPGAALVGKACARYIVMHCRGVQPGGGREVACLTNYVNSGTFVGPRCRAALQVTGLLR